MPPSDHAPDILSSMPLWVQVSANLGMFVVAVVTAAYGFFKKHVTTLVPAEHFAEGGMLATFTEDIHSIATSLRGIYEIMQGQQREDAIEREVERRVSEKHSR